VVAFAPGGIAGLLLRHRPLLRAGQMWPVLRAYVVAAPPTLVMLAGLVLGIEIVVRHTVDTSDDPVMHLFGFTLDTGSPLSWAIAALLTLVGFALARFTWQHVARVFDDAMTVARAKGYLA
jgi:branched-chain amino acid transport system permease protein